MALARAQSTPRSARSSIRGHRYSRSEVPSAAKPMVVFVDRADGEQRAAERSLSRRARETTAFALGADDRAPIDTPKETPLELLKEVERLVITFERDTGGEGPVTARWRALVADLLEVCSERAWPVQAASGSRCVMRAGNTDARPAPVARRAA
jgi:hypothetical protein